MERLNSPASVQVPGVNIREIEIDQLPVIRRLNVTIFEEHRIINRLDRKDLMMLVAFFEQAPVGFKVGYGEENYVFYSAKGGVLPPYRRRGIARWLLYEMIGRARAKGYKRFAFDTLPNRDHGMTILGLNEGFEIVGASFNEQFKDYLLRFEKEL